MLVNSSYLLRENDPLILLTHTKLRLKCPHDLLRGLGLHDFLLLPKPDHSLPLCHVIVLLLPDLFKLLGLKFCKSLCCLFLFLSDPLHLPILLNHGFSLHADLDHPDLLISSLCGLLLASLHRDA